MRLRPIQVGDRVLIWGTHPARNSTGRVEAVQRVQELFGGGTGYAVSVDGMTGHRVGCRAHELIVLESQGNVPTRKRAKKGKR